MSTAGSRWTDERVEGTIGQLLRIGVLIAGAVVFAGAIVYLVRHGGQAPQYAVFHGEPADLRTVPGIIADALQGRGRGLIQLGLLLLIATPIARVVFSLLAFIRQRDRLYIAVTLLVLATLCYGLVGGKG